MKFLEGPSPGSSRGSCPITNGFSIGSSAYPNIFKIETERTQKESPVLISTLSGFFHGLCRVLQILPSLLQPHWPGTRGHCLLLHRRHPDQGGKLQGDKQRMEDNQTDTLEARERPVLKTEIGPCLET